MSVRENLAKLKWSMRLLGPRPTTLASLAKVGKLLGYDMTQSDGYWDYIHRCFDERFDVETTEHIVVDKLDVDAADRPGMSDYEPTSPVAFGTTIERLSVDFRDYIFVDYGCGKGRALFMAAFFPFRRIIGVELATDLTEQASQNVEQFRNRTGQADRFDVVQENATTYGLPAEPAVLYFYNPFDANLMTQVLAVIERSWQDNPRHLVCVYHNPRQRHVFDEADFLTLTSETENVFPWLVYETVKHI